MVFAGHGVSLGSCVLGHSNFIIILVVPFDWREWCNGGGGLDRRNARWMGGVRFYLKCKLRMRIRRSVWYDVAL